MSVAPAKRASRPSKTRKPTVQSPTKARAKSEELGDDEFMVRYNSRTGRPIRTSAGRKSLNPSYVNPDDAIADFLDSPDEPRGGTPEAVPMTRFSDMESEDDSEIETRPKKKPKKRARTPTPPPSPPPPPLSPSVHDEIEVFARSDSPDPPTPEGTADAGITLTFNIPPGFQGPLVVKLDTASLSRTAKPIRRPAHVASTGHASRNSNRVCKFVGKACEHSLPMNDNKRGFLDLPPELRNKVYRLLFVTKEPLDFHNPYNFSRSAALLATCKQVYAEGRGILYSENNFNLERDRGCRAPYWSNKTQEVGFKDIRRFLTSIGPGNIAMLRDVFMILEDAMPSVTPGFTNEERRYVHDDHLIECLKMLGRHAKLRKLGLCCNGRKVVDRTDYRFLDALKSITADEVSVTTHPRYGVWAHHTMKIRHVLKMDLIEEMTREEKLYTATG